MKETNTSYVCGSETELIRALTRGAAIGSRAELAHWLQHDVQPWVPHQLLLWAEFRDGIEECAVLSAPAQLRDHMERGGCVPKLMAYFADCWIAAQHTPMYVPLAGCEALLGPDIQALQQRNARAALVHGVVDRHSGARRVFAWLGPLSYEPAPAPLKLFVAVLDTVMRSIPLPAPAHVEGTTGKALSERERQIMHWIALGKTNPEIGCILEISEFTVKNHIKSIFAKLDVSNRAQAVATLNRLNSYA